MTVEFKQCENETVIRLTHAGFYDEETKNRTEQAWPSVLAQLEDRLKKLIELN